MSTISFRDIKLPPEVSRITVAELRKLRSSPDVGPSSTKKTRGGKYNAKKVVTEEMTFDSTQEYKRFLELKLLEKAGAIHDLRCQVRFPLEKDGFLIETYVADFVYQEAGKEVVEDVKGFLTRDYKRKRKFMKQLLGIEIFETGNPQSKSKKAKKKPLGP